MNKSDSAKLRLPPLLKPLGPVTVWYFVLASAWILLSDGLVLLFTDEPDMTSAIRTSKDWVFVLVTTFLIGLLHRNDRRARGTIHAATVRERQAVEDIARSEARFRSLVQNSSDMIRLLGRNGEILYESPSVERILGYEPNASIGKNTFSRIHPDDVDWVREAFLEGVRKGAAPATTYRVRHADGRWVWIESTGESLLDDPDVGAFVLHSRDVTERVEAEEVRARLAAVVDSSNDAIISKDLDGIITSWNQAAERLFGYTEEEAVGRHITFLSPSEREHEDAEILERVRRGERTEQYETVRRRRDGSLIDVSLTVSPTIDEHGRIIGASNVARDITDRKQAEEALREEQAFITSLLDVMPGIFYTIDEDGKYVRWNKNFERVTGYTAAELAQLGPADLVSEGAEAVDRLLSIIMAGRAATAPLTLLSRNGERLRYLCTGVRVSMGGRTYITGTGIDIAEQQRGQARIEALNAELQERVDRLTSLNEIDRAITGSLDLTLVLNVFLEQVLGRLSVDAAAVLLPNQESQELRFVTSKGFRTSALRSTRLRLGEGQAGRAALEQETVHLADRAAFEEAFREARELSIEGFECYWAVPLMAKGRVQGVLELFSRREMAPDDDWYNFLEALATQAAIAIDNAVLFRGLERSNLDLRLAYDTTIEGWARALDLRDEETEGHSRRVTDMTVALARKLGFGEEEIVQVRRGALLHDIGKMGVPDQILLKAGKLDPEEWELMKRHTTYAYELLHPIRFLRPALDIPCCHHEKWDGSGYPRGLKGDQIPLSARIFAVVDVYDALTSDRPYRPAWPRERVLSYIREQSGTHFDPEVVQAFLELVDPPPGGRPVAASG